MFQFINALIAISFFAAVTLSLFYYLKARNSERMAMIEKGAKMDLDSGDNSSRTLKIGIFFIGIAIGFLAGYWLDVEFKMPESSFCCWPKDSSD